jgi:hypothetical protein
MFFSNILSQRTWRWFLATARTATFSTSLQFVAAIVCGQTPAEYPLILSSNGRYVVDQAGRPFFINGEAAWSLISAVSKEDAELYLEDRRLKGFNLVVVTLVDRKFSPDPPRNFYGEAPFAVDGDFSTPREAYFSHADWVIDKAREKGIVVMLAPLYLGSGCGDEGWCREIHSSPEETIREYGRYIGNRYRSFPNLIWLIGGDTDPSGSRDGAATVLRRWFRQSVLGAQGVAGPAPVPDVQDKVRAFVAGLREHDRVHLISAHNARNQTAMDPWPDEPWLDLNNIYTDAQTYTAARREWARRPFKPFFLVESFYENEHASTPLSLRRQAYWAVLSGGVLGHVFGNCQIWGFSYGFCADSWKAQLDSEGSRTLALLGRLFSSRSFFLLEPERRRVTTIPDHQYGLEYVASASASDGSTMMSYLPVRKTVIADLSGISGPSTTAWWFNPRSGDAVFIGTYPTSFRLEVLPPAEQDWVLVVDSTSLSAGPPGGHAR